MGRMTLRPAVGRACADRADAPPQAAPMSRPFALARDGSEQHCAPTRDIQRRVEDIHVSSSSLGFGRRPLADFVAELFPGSGKVVQELAGGQVRFLARQFTTRFCMLSALFGAEGLFSHTGE